MCSQRDWCSAAVVHTGGCLHENLRISTQALVCVYGLQRYAASRRPSRPSPLTRYVFQRTTKQCSPLSLYQLDGIFLGIESVVTKIVSCDSRHTTYSNGLFYPANVINYLKTVHFTSQGFDYEI